jgi:hypothetical protein
MNSAALLAHFAVYGRFYGRPVAGVDELLRDRLEIAPVGMPLPEVLGRESDLLVVMMNPGASRPLDALWDEDESDGFASAQPDRTQYQIMRLLLAAQGLGMPWKHARILNLSDLRTPKSAVFLEKLQTYDSDRSHSLFSFEREAECGALFAAKPTPVLCGWGLNPRLGELAAAALQMAEGHPILGLTTDALLYRHPLPQRYDLQVQWLAQLTDQISTLSRT